MIDMTDFDLQMGQPPTDDEPTPGSASVSERVSEWVRLRGATLAQANAAWNVMVDDTIRERYASLFGALTFTEKAQEVLAEAGVVEALRKGADFNDIPRVTFDHTGEITKSSPASKRWHAHKCTEVTAGGPSTAVYGYRLHAMYGLSNLGAQGRVAVTVLDEYGEVADEYTGFWDCDLTAPVGSADRHRIVCDTEVPALAEQAEAKRHAAEVEWDATANEKIADRLRTVVWAFGEEAGHRLVGEALIQAYARRSEIDSMRDRWDAAQWHNTDWHSFELPIQVALCAPLREDFCFESVLTLRHTPEAIERLLGDNPHRSVQHRYSPLIRARGWEGQGRLVDLQVLKAIEEAREACAQAARLEADSLLAKALRWEARRLGCVVSETARVSSFVTYDVGWHMRQGAMLQIDWEGSDRSLRIEVPETASAMSATADIIERYLAAQS